jgi:Family of unknown function (DUF6590)
MASSRGKHVDKTTEWSDAKLDERTGRWYNERTGPSGKTEYHWHPGSTTTADPSIPRSDMGFGTSESSGFQSQQSPLSYSQPSTPARGSYPPAGSYTTSRDGGSFYSSAYSGQLASTGTQSSRSLSYGESYEGSSNSQATPYGSQYQSWNYGSASSENTLRMASLSSSTTYASRQDYQDLPSTFSGMQINPLVETGTVQQCLHPKGWPFANKPAASSQMLIPKHIHPSPGPNSSENLDASTYLEYSWRENMQYLIRWTGYRQVPDNKQKNFWQVGRVFMMLWTEPASPQVPNGGGTRNGSHFSTVWLNEQAYSEIRRFVVMKEQHGNSICS